MSHSIQMFFKFGAEEHILDLYENGTVYLNTIEYFRKCEDDELRGDNYEGASRIINSLPGNFVLPGTNHTVNFQKVHVKESYKDLVGNFFCLYCVSSFGFPDLNLFKVDSKNLRFGTHGIMIKEPGTFIDKVDIALNQAGYQFGRNFVEYYDKTAYSGELTLFHKSMEFEYQKEFRFSVENQILEPIKLNIGSMKTYSQIFKMEDVMQMELRKNQTFKK